MSLLHQGGLSIKDWDLPNEYGRATRNLGLTIAFGVPIIIAATNLHGLALCELILGPFRL